MADESMVRNLAAQAQAIRVDTLKNRWHELDVDEKRLALLSTLDHVTVLPSKPGAPRVFDPLRLVIEWGDVSPEEEQAEQRMTEEAQAGVA